MKRRDFLRHAALSTVALTAAPAAGVPAFPSKTATAAQCANSTQTSGQLRQELRVALLDSLNAWFPRSLDRKYGGFLCDFDARWNPTGPHNKMLEFQARQTRAAAQAALYDRSLSSYREAAEHGFRYLRERMWDERYGGWYKKLDRAGRVLDAGTKHGHGTAYAIQACVAHHRLTRNPESLKLAREAFLWLEKHAYDRKYQGYVTFYRRDGTPILSADENPIGKRTRDHLGRPVGLRDDNTALDLLEALADLYAVRADALVRERVIEVLELCLNRFIVAPGVVVSQYHRDWSPASSELELGLSVQAANVLLKVSAVLFGATSAELARAAQGLVDSCLRFAWDTKNGGFYYSGRVVDESVVITSRAKEWWVQAEGLRALLAMALLCDANQINYANLFQRQWKYVTAFFIDSRHKGWNKTGTDTRAGPGVKGQEWKDASHEVRALIECIRMLERA